jgi:hypothetical protein
MLTFGLLKFCVFDRDIMLDLADFKYNVDVRGAMTRREWYLDSVNFPIVFIIYFQSRLNSRGFFH